MLDDQKKRELKTILLSMNNSEVPLEKFCEILEKETQGFLTFSSLKNSIDKHYSNISKSNILYLKFR